MPTRDLHVARNRQPDAAHDTAPDDDQLLTVRDVCGGLRCSRSFVYGLFGRGELRWVTLGRSRRVARSELRRFLEARQRGGWNAEGAAASTTERTPHRPIEVT